MELADTVKLMGSLDWKDRLKAEYWQLKLRTSKLNMSINNNDIPQCTKDILYEQLIAMDAYISVLEKRIKLYNLTDYINDTSDMV